VSEQRSRPTQKLTRSAIADIAGRVADETEAGVDSVEWCARNNIDLDAMQAIFESIERQLHNKVAQDGDVLGAVLDLTGQAFRLGWEASRV